MLHAMGTSERPADRGRRHGRGLVNDVVREFRLARLGASLSQERVGRALGRSDAWISWTESGRNETLSIADAAAMLACVGMQLSVRAYPAGGRLRDSGQLALLAAFRNRVVPPWNWAAEVPIPIPGDLRAWDCVLSLPRCRIGVEAESRIRDAQAVDRRVQLKQRDSALDRAIVLVADTQTNRAALRAVGPAFWANYPVASSAALHALEAGADPGGNAVILLRAASPR